MATFEERAMLRQLQALHVNVEHERERARTAATSSSPQLPATRAGARRGWERDMQKYISKLLFFYFFVFLLNQLLVLNL